MMCEAYKTFTFTWERTAECHPDIAHLFNNGQHPGLVVVVTVGANAEVDFVWVRIRLVGRSELENAVGTGERVSLINCGVLPIGWSQGHTIPRFYGP